MSRARDLHKSLKSEVLAKTTVWGAELALVKLAWGKQDTAFSLHVAPNTFSTSGLQIPDLLSYLGLSRQPCSFLQRAECYTREVQADLDLDAFGKALGVAYQQLSEAEKYLGACGLTIPQPEGWGCFLGRQSVRHAHRGYRNDGHTSSTSPQAMKTSEDEAFSFVFTWIKNSESDKGWTIHYRPKHPPLSVDLQNAFAFLGIEEFPECPQFEFEPCSWRYIEFEEQDDHLFNSTTALAHGWFDAHQKNFSSGIKALLTAQSSIEMVGMSFLPSFAKPETRRTQEIVRRITSKAAKGELSPELSQFDVAISFAGTERPFAEDLATRVKAAGFQVFYDEFFPEDLWGKNLGEFFHEIYSKRSRYCVIFVSSTYLQREWTIHERRSAQERMLKEKGNEYILPVKVENVELPGIPSTIGYLPISTGIEKIADALIKKLSLKK